MTRLPASLEFKRLLVAVETLLRQEYFLPATRQALTDTFIHGLYEIYALAFDVSVSVNQLEELTKAIQGNRNPLDYAEFMVKTLHNKKAYMLLNYYVAQFILTTLKIVKKDKRAEIEAQLQKTGITRNSLTKHGLDSTPVV